MLTRDLKPSQSQSRKTTEAHVVHLSLNSSDVERVAKISGERIRDLRRHAFLNDVGRQDDSGVWSFTVIDAIKLAVAVMLREAGWPRPDAIALGGVAAVPLALMARETAVWGEPRVLFSWRLAPGIFKSPIAGSSFAEFADDLDRHIDQFDPRFLTAPAAVVLDLRRLFDGLTPELLRLAAQCGQDGTH
jgi:hypothetical protein